jgi:hypothetical protein
MSCECTNTQDLGCFVTCSTITFGTAAQTGNHTLAMKIRPGVVINKTIAVTAANPIAITDDGSELQPGYSYVVNITNPDGTEFTVTSGATTYDCFKFSLYITRSQ